MSEERILQSIGSKSTTVISVIARYLGIIGIGAIAVSTLMTGVDVVARYFFSKPIPGVYQLSEMLLILIIALPLAYCQQMKAHIRVDVFITRLHGKPRAMFELLTVILALFLFGLTTWTTAVAAWQSFVAKDYVEGLIHYPHWPARTMIPIGTGCFCLRLMIDAAHYARDLFRTADVVGVKSETEITVGL